MMIWKYEIIISNDAVKFQIPINSTILFVDEQDGKLMMWVLVDPKEIKKLRLFLVVGTGDGFNPELHYIGSAQIDEFVWHVLEVA